MRAPAEQATSKELLVVRIAAVMLTIGSLAVLIYYQCSESLYIGLISRLIPPIAGAFLQATMLLAKPSLTQASRHF